MSTVRVTWLWKPLKRAYWTMELTASSTARMRRSLSRREIGISARDSPSSPRTSLRNFGWQGFEIVF